MSLVFTILSMVFLLPSQGFSQDAAKLFKGNCASCHKPTTQKLVGPGLQGVRSRWTDEAKLIAWVKNSQDFLKTGDSYAKKLFADYGNSVMPAFALSDAEIIAIVDWADKGGDAPAATEATDSAAGATTSAGEGGEPADSETYMYILLGIAALLLILISVLNTVKKSLQSLVNEKNGVIVEPQPHRSPYQQAMYWASQNKKIVALAGLFLTVWVLKLGWDGLMGVGVYEGYAPEQPIKFSHELHAGQNKIACVYCHSSVEKSKHANIPSANVCMNCHAYIQQGPKYGSEEISKIYAALDYNPETRSYGPNQKPIKWIRVHSLPDHVYFNHSQHVTVGKLECAQCHGPIDSMEVVRQYSPLTMGWCINCHRETAVQWEGNEYYEELHKKFLEDSDYKKGDVFTVEKIGGLECSKCHY
ncbi:MAG: c-type cytochrome [Bacteroidetes bacterium]|nr:c-type cytochrome [Bacteroidota bacterium]